MKNPELKEKTVELVALAIEDFIGSTMVGNWINLKESSISLSLKKKGIKTSQYATFIREALKRRGLIYIELEKNPGRALLKNKGFLSDYKKIAKEAISAYNEYQRNYRASKKDLTPKRQKDYTKEIEKIEQKDNLIKITNYPLSKKVFVLYEGKILQMIVMGKRFVDKSMTHIEYSLYRPSDDLTINVRDEFVRLTSEELIQSIQIEKL